MKKSLWGVAIVLFAITSCTTTKFVSSGQNLLEKYRIGYIVSPMEYSTSASLGSMDIKISITGEIWN